MHAHTHSHACTYMHGHAHACSALCPIIHSFSFLPFSPASAATVQLFCLAACVRQGRLATFPVGSPAAELAEGPSFSGTCTFRHLLR